MDRALLVPALILLFGLGLIVVGYSIGPQGGHYFLIMDNVSEDELPSGAVVVEYDTLSPRTQHAFREALKKEEVTATPQFRFESGQGGFPSDMPHGEYLLYRGRYYQIEGLHRDDMREGLDKFFKWSGGFLVLFSAFAAWTMRD